MTAKRKSYSFTEPYAEVVKLVDTQVSGTCGGNPVEVRVLSSAHVNASVDVLTQSFHYGQDPWK